MWLKAENALREIVREKGVDAKEMPGEAAFYGPKIDFRAKDSIGRTWQVATIQLDMNMPERFDLTCIDEEGKPERIAMIHAAIMGSIERFLSVAIEHYAGAFPLWMAPEQVRVASVGEAHVEAVKRVVAELNDAGVRAGADISDATVGAKIRNAAKMKIPYTIVFGDKELEGGAYTVNVFGSEENLTLSAQEMAAHVRQTVAEQMGL